LTKGNVLSFDIACKLNHQRRKEIWVGQVRANLRIPEAQALAKQQHVSIRSIVDFVRALASLNSFTARGKVWASQKWLSAHLNLSKRQIMRIVRVLRERGLLEVDRPVRNGRNLMTPIFLQPKAREKDAASVTSEVTLGHLAGHLQIADRWRKSLSEQNDGRRYMTPNLNNLRERKKDARVATSMPTPQAVRLLG
jgi:hypothetical protein